MIRMIVFDIDGVLTDGRKYVDGNGVEFKALQLKDLDALGMLAESGYRVGCISGEETGFSRQFLEMDVIDHIRLGCKDKERALRDIASESKVKTEEICYIGDGKYDIPALRISGLSVCPKDAIQEVKEIADIVLKSKGGEGCIAECYSYLKGCKGGENIRLPEEGKKAEHLLQRIEEHQNVVNKMMEDKTLLMNTERAIQMIVDSYKEGGKLFLCGNGGSAADAQHLAAELVGRFYLERRAWSAEALTTNTSIITALANDYGYDSVFARQIEAKAGEGDILIGITTSGTSRNICNAFKQAKKMGVKTILMTGELPEYCDILEYTDCMLGVPSKDTARIQEMHIMAGHVICECVEQRLF